MLINVMLMKKNMYLFSVRYFIIIVKGFMNFRFDTDLHRESLGKQLLL